jgi:hypothetical protein
MKKYTGKSLNRNGLQELRDLVRRMEQHRGPWSTVEGREQTGERSFVMPYVVPAPIVDEAMMFLYEHNLIVQFDWSEWDEGRAIFRDESDDRFANLDRTTVLKLLTAVARNDRFCEGAWAALFDAGDARKLFSRLLETETGSA